MQKNVVYLSHGGRKYYDQTRFSVLTLLDLLIKQERRDVRIFIFTDCPAESPDHELISSIYVSPADLARFRGPLDYVHRIKLEVLRRAEREIGLPFIYVDCDTRWLKIPDEQFTILADSGQRTADSGQRTAESSDLLHAQAGGADRHWILPSIFPPVAKEEAVACEMGRA